MKVVFMGTPEFAVAVLDEINNKSNHEVVGVVTIPDKPSGRGQKMNSSAVKKYAEEHNLSLFQPKKLRDEKFITDLKALEADVFVVVAFRMLPKVIWEIPKRGTFNLHASLLPDYRGAAPINWVIIKGERETGVTTFLIDEEIDTGNILLKETLEIKPNDNAGMVHDKLMEIGKKLVVKTIEGLEKETLKPYPQTESVELKLAPKIFKEDCQIDWSKGIVEVHNQIRGLSPYPGAWTEWNKDVETKQLKIYQGKIAEESFEKQVLTMIVEKSKLYVQLEDGVYEIEELQAEGKRRMSSRDFINGLGDYNNLCIK